MMRFVRITLLVGLALSLVADAAHAWGPRAQRTIAYMALQVIQPDFPNLLREYEDDVLRGCEEGYGVLGEGIPLNSDSEVVDAIIAQIILLRGLRENGVGSYYAYRMGVLAAMVSDVMLPYGFAWTATDKALRDRVAEDIDKHLDSYSYNVDAVKRTFIATPRVYFTENRSFFHDNKELIADDYARGIGYRGFLLKAGPEYFKKSVSAVADVWYTILQHLVQVPDQPVSRSAQALYFVDEVEYLLTVKKNYAQACIAYDHFEGANTGAPEPIERVGDLFYAFGSEQAIRRAVSEYRTAYELAGANREQVGKKLAGHYLVVGKKLLESGQKPRALETDLPNALQSFQEALLFDRYSEEAASLVQEANKAIERRAELFKMNQDIIANAERMREEAARAFSELDYGTAISTYKNAIALFEGVGEDFEKQATTAKDGISAVKKDIAKVLQTIIDKATEAIDAGERAREQREYDTAIGSYGQVEVILSEIPDDGENSKLAEDKTELINMARTKIEETKKEQADYVERMRQAQQNPPAAGGANKPAGQPPAAGQ